MSTQVRALTLVFLAAVAVAFGCVAATASGGSSSHIRTLVQTGAPIVAFAQDGPRMAWVQWEPGRSRCGGRIYIADLRTGKRDAIDPCTAAPSRRWVCCGLVALAGSQALLQLEYHSRLGDRFLLVSATPGTTPHVVGETAYAMEEGPAGVVIPLPFAGDGRDFAFLTECNMRCRSRVHALTLWGLHDGRKRLLRRIRDHLEFKVLATSAGRVAIPTSQCGCIGSPTWSPDGRLIAYTTRRHALHGEPGDIYVMKSNGGGQRRLTRSKLVMGDLDWSPDGRRLLFSGVGGSIYSVDALGRNLHRIVRGIDPAWAPNGRELAFARAGRIYVRGIGGGSDRAVARGAQPTWSPDGRQLAYTRNGSLFIVDKDGRGERRIASSADPELPWDEMAPDWSADGQLIAFADLGPNDTAQIFGVHPDGSGRQQLTAARDLAADPAWSRDGRLAYVDWDVGLTGPAGGPNVYVMRVGGRPKRLTDDGPSQTLVEIIDASTGRKVTVAHTSHEDVATVALTRRYLAAASHTRIEFFTVSGRRLGAVSFPCCVYVVSAAGRSVVAVGGRGQAYVIDVPTRRIRRIASGQAIGLSIEGTRIAWAERFGRGGRIRALDIKARS